MLICLVFKTLINRKKSIATISNFNPFPSDNVCMFSKSIEYPLFFIPNSLILLGIQKKPGIGKDVQKISWKFKNMQIKLFIRDIGFSLQLYNCNNYVWNYCSTHVLICTGSIVSRHYSHNFTSLMFFFLVKVKFDTSFYERVDKSFKSFD